MSLQPMSFSDSPTNLLVSGCYRSGTTLLEKLLHHHENICLASQPFPIFYFYSKLAFYDEINIQRRYPMEHLFLERDYQAQDFHAFLDRFTLSDKDIGTIFDEMADYTLGLWTPEMLKFRDQIVPGTFIQVYRQLNNCVAQLFPKQDIRYLGGKEVLCEEYVPYLLSKGAKVITVIRDPRDMITSLNFRERDNLTGFNRPVLYSLRAWRKSVAIALEHETHPNFLWVRYQDLARDPITILNRAAAFLDLPEFSAKMFSQGIYDQRGDIWKGNSSFDDRTAVSTNSVGKFAAVLPRHVLAYIEACCWPEIKALGYDFHLQSRFDATAIRAYHEPFEIRHAKFAPDYSVSDEHVAEEIERYHKLISMEPLATQQAKQWFLYERVFKKLRSAVGEA